MHGLLHMSQANGLGRSTGGVTVPDVPVPGSVQATAEGRHFDFRTYLAYAGPGLLVATAYADPGSIEAALASGTFFGMTCTLIKDLSKPV